MERFFKVNGYSIFMEKRRIYNYVCVGIILYVAIQLSFYASDNPLYPINFYDLLDELVHSFWWLVFIIPLIYMLGYTQYLHLNMKVSKACYFKIPFYPFLLSTIIFIPLYTWIYFTCGGESCIGLVTIPLIYAVYIIALVLFAFLLAFLLNISQRSLRISKAIENLDRILIYLAYIVLFISLIYSFLWATEWWKYFRFLGIKPIG